MIPKMVRLFSSFRTLVIILFVSGPRFYIGHQILKLNQYLSVCLSIDCLFICSFILSINIYQFILSIYWLLVHSFCLFSNCFFYPSINLSVLLTANNSLHKTFSTNQVCLYFILQANVIFRFWFSVMRACQNRPDSHFWITTHRSSIFINWKLENAFNESPQEFMFVSRYCSPRRVMPTVIPLNILSLNISHITFKI